MTQINKEALDIATESMRPLFREPVSYLMSAAEKVITAYLAAAQASDVTETSETLARLRQIKAESCEKALPLTAAAAKIAELERERDGARWRGDAWHTDAKQYHARAKAAETRAAALEKALREAHKLLHESASGMTFRDAEAGKRYTAAIALMVAALTTEPRP
jgi:hypothetical protein